LYSPQRCRDIRSGAIDNAIVLAHLAARNPLRDVHPVDRNVSQRAAVLALLEVPLRPSVRISRPIVERMLATE
jgi:hypothetical protein